MPSHPALTSRERWEMGLLFAAILLTTVGAFALAFTYLPHNAPSDVTHSFLLFTGLGITAYVLGLRHGFDADHIAAIDNTTRKLLNEGKRPLTVGTWFSLGHSTIVCGLVVALVVVTGFVQAHVAAFAAVTVPSRRSRTMRPRSLVAGAPRPPFRLSRRKPAAVNSKRRRSFCHSISRRLLAASMRPCRSYAVLGQSRGS